MGKFSALLTVLILVSVTGALSSLDIIVPDPLTEITAENAASLRDRGEIRLVGPRNGFCSAQTVAYGAGAGTLRAKLSPLEKGKEQIPGQAVQIRYASIPVLTHLRNDGNYKIEARYSNNPFSDTLNDVPDASAQVNPVWITVHIPADTEPGEYRGFLHFGARKIPVILEVSGWLLPGPAQWVSHIGLIQSPESVALQYGVQLWSKEHLALMEKIFAMMAGVGNNELYITCVNKMHLGNEFSVIRFKEAGGQFTPDFTLFEKLLAMFIEQGGDLRSLILYIWDPEMLGSAKKPGPKEISITVVNGTALSEKQAPMFGRPGSENMWKAVVEGVKDRVKKAGLDEDIILLGLGGDQRPDKETAGFFKAAAPGIKWTLFTHGRGDGLIENGELVLDGLDIGQYEIVYPPEGVIPADGIMGGWDIGFRQLCHPRVLIFQYSLLSQWRNMPEGCFAGPQFTGEGRGTFKCSAGITRLCFDFWEINKERPLLGKFSSHWLTRMYRRAPRSFSAPGADAPAGTVRYEMFREGLQELEARIMIEKTVSSKKVSGAALRMCTDILLERVNVRLRNGEYKPSPGVYGKPELQTEMDGVWGISDDWQGLVKKLYDAAFAAARISGQKQYIQAQSSKEPVSGKTPEKHTRTSAKPDASNVIEQLKEKVIADTKNGRTIKVNFRLGASTESAEIISADEANLTVKTGNMEMPCPWDRLPAEVLVSLKKHYRIK